MDFQNKIAKVYLVEVLALLMEELDNLREQDKNVTVHIETDFLKIHEDFSPDNIEVDIDNGQISIDSLEVFGDRSWVLDLNNMYGATIDNEFRLLKFRNLNKDVVVFQF